jgi:hypothetical protein
LAHPRRTEVEWHGSAGRRPARLKTPRSPRADWNDGRGPLSLRDPDASCVRATHAGRGPRDRPGPVLRVLARRSPPGQGRSDAASARLPYQAAEITLAVPPPARATTVRRGGVHCQSRRRLQPSS